jgi:predicted 3-demethylubiquinone-9 3-methyltransferase (glyoxalase superfamily)
MSKITTFLTFNDQAEPAAKHYVSIIPNSRIVEITRYPEGAPAPAGSVMVVSFELDGRPFAALNGGPHFTFSEGVSLSVECKDQAEIDLYWAKLSDGGEEGPCGWLKDRFGLSWQIVPAGIAELVSRPGAMEAMMGMKKLVIADLRAAGRARAGSAAAAR